MRTIRRKKKTRSSGESRIIEILKEYSIQYHKEHSYPNCVNPKTGCRLRFDFYLPEYNLLIEFQGHHHYAPINKYHRAKRAHLKTLAHDQIKRDFVTIHKINFLEIDYRNYKLIFDIIKEKITEIVGE